MASFWDNLVNTAQQTAGAIGQTAGAYGNLINQQYIQPNLPAAYYSQPVQTVLQAPANTLANANLAKQQIVAASQNISNPAQPNTLTPGQAALLAQQTGVYNDQNISTTNNMANYNTAGQIPASQSPDTPNFSFDFNAEEKAAYAQLQPFYEKLLSFANGDMDLAKRILQYTYDQGIRESSQTAANDTKNLQLTFPGETNTQLTTQNRRGVLQSGFGNTERDNLKQSQDLRMLEVNQALENRNSNLQNNLSTGSEQAQNAYNEQKFNLEKQRQTEAGTMANQKLAVDTTNYNANLNKSAATEANRVQGTTNQVLSNIAGGGATNTGNTGTTATTGRSDSDFRSYMASTGRQGELDKATVGGTQQGSAYAALKKQYGY